MSTKATPKPVREAEDPTDDLPEGWAAAALSDIHIHALGGTWGDPPADRVPRDQIRVAVLRGTEFRHWLRDKGTTAAERLVDMRSFEKRRLSEGDIVVEISGGGPDQPVGRTLVVDADALSRASHPLICSNFCRQVRIHSEINAWYVDWAIKHSYAKGHLNRFQTETTNIRNLTFTDFAAEPLVPLAPSKEQSRIVAKIEELLTHVNASRERLAKVPKLLKAFRQSVLAAACSGRLTEDWRQRRPNSASAEQLVAGIKASHQQRGAGHGGQAAEPTEGVHDLEQQEFPETWCLEELRWLCRPGRPITYGILKPGPDTPGGVPYIRVADFPRNILNPHGVRRTTQAIAREYRRSILEAGDILLSIRGSVGRVCRVPNDLAGANITQDTARISVHPDLSADYVELYLTSPDTQRRFEAAMRGVAVRGVNIGDVRATQVAIPPLHEQHEIVRRVERLFKLADRIEKRVEAATKRADKLTQAVLAKAFRGELVPTEAELARAEGRDYEPASVLLERIKCERQNSPLSNSTPHRRRGPKST